MTVGTQQETPRDDRFLALARNSLSGVGRVVVLALIAFFLTPFVLRSLGEVRYGVWALLGGFTGALWLADLGVTGAVTRFVAFHLGRRDHEAASEVASTAVAVLAGAAGVVLLGVALASGLLVDTFLDQAPQPAPQLRLLLVAVVAVALAGIVAQGWRGALVGAQRLGLVDVSSVAAALLNAGLVVWFLGRGMGIPGLILALATANLVTASAELVAFRQVLPEVRLSWRRVSRARAREIVGFGLNLAARRVGNFVTWEMDKLLLGAIGTLAPVGWYALAALPVMRLRQVPEMLLRALGPSTADAVAREDAEALRRLHDEGHRFLAVAAGALAWGPVALAAPFIALWLGPGYPEVATAMTLLAVGHAFSLTLGPGTEVLVASGRPDVVARLAWISLALNGLASVALVRDFGLWGVVGATVGTFALTSVAFGLWIRRSGTVGVDPAFPVLRTYLGPVAAGAVAWAVTAFLLPTPGSWPAFLAVFAAFSALYAAGLLLLGHLDVADVRFLGRVLGRRGSR